MEELIWRASMNGRQVTTESVPPGWQRLGGRGLIPRVLLEEVPPTCDPLGPFNKLIWAPGLLGGHMISSCDRISVGGKSPLTGGVKESNAGGSTGLKLARLGIKALILEGATDNDNWWLLHLSSEGGRFEPADDLAGLGVYQAAKFLLKRFGPKVGAALIGPGGEMELRAAGIYNLDQNREPSRVNARGGLGAVMGSKRLKAIVIEASGGQKPPIAHPQAFRQAQKEFNTALMEHPQTQVYADYGTAAMTSLGNSLGSLPTRNFSSGQIEGAERISGEYMRQLLLERGGESETTHACMAGCIIRCSNTFGDADGKAIVSPLEYETIGLMGSNLGITDLDTIAHLNWELNDLGLDAIEIGAALGVAADAGIMEFGDGTRALELLAEIRASTSLGWVLGNGAAVTGRVLRVKRVPVVKGQAMAAYDPRAIKGTGVTYATSPQGADHTAGNTIRAQVNHLNPQGQAALSRAAQISRAGYDTLGACTFSGFGFAKAPGAIRDLLNARYGWQVGDDILQQLGRATLTLEREFNRRAGFTPADDRLPEWMTQEPLPPHNTVFDVPEADLDDVFNW
ncbi:MAG: aldehyde ferredoxin oxidoreductase C-terminal domain-containing protein [Chloroflexota bacterium]|nr:aldehyde ferredoxin oxidoreductase C-terminal domain-containing protein [Chloroflexota bacterium]